MIYFLHGSATQEVTKKTNSLVADLLKKKPDASFFTLTDENWSEDVVEEYLSSQGLFENKYIVVVKNIFSGEGSSTADKKARKEILLKKVTDLAESPHIFILAEGSVDKVTLAKIGKYAQKVQEFSDEPDRLKGLKNSADVWQGAHVRAGNDNTKDFKIFDLADALSSRDKKTLWVLYRQAIEMGKAPEEIHGILFWQVKSMIISTRAKTAVEAGINPFVFSKAQRYSTNFSSKDLGDMLVQLVSMYHDAHRGIHDFETVIELFILEK